MVSSTLAIDSVCGCCGVPECTGSLVNFSALRSYSESQAGEASAYPVLLRSRTAMVPEDMLDTCSSSGSELETPRQQQGFEGKPGSPCSTTASSDDDTCPCSVGRSRTAMLPPCRRQRSAVLIDGDCCEISRALPGLERLSRWQRLRGWAARAFKLERDDQ